jgi:predicted DNA-binding protein with PD1-like motif/glutaredoxin
MAMAAPGFDAVPLHLAPGEDVRKCLESFARSRRRSGFVLSVVGNLSQAAFACPGKAGPTVLVGELEIITLTGTVAPEGVHLHLSFSDGDCRVWGGHLEQGTLVLKGADLLVGLLPNVPGTPPQTQLDTAHAGPRLALAIRAGCPYSARARRLLRTLGIDHQLIEPIDGHSVPQVFLDGVFIGGYDALAELHGRGELEALRGG